jgi:hypothetical protein
MQIMQTMKSMFGLLDWRGLLSLPVSGVGRAGQASPQDAGTERDKTFPKGICKCQAVSLKHARTP